MNPVDKLLNVLDKAKRTGPNRWIARCPAHDDGSPSLAITERDDGAALIHCFGGCATGDVLAAVGLDLSDLFPPRPANVGGGGPATRRPFNAGQLIDRAAEEAMVCAVIASDIVNGKADPDIDRLIVAASRLLDVKEAVHG